MQTIHPNDSPVSGTAADTSGLDDFLASALASAIAPKPVSEGLTAGSPAPAQAGSTALMTIAEIDHQDVADVVMLIPAADAGDRFSVDTEVMAGLRGEVQAWLAMLREQGQMVTELLPLSVRDQSARKLANQLLAVAYKSPNQAWTAMLPTGRQIVIAPSHVINTVGFEGVCRTVHKTAILAAQAAGQPFNERAFSFYQGQSPAQVN